MTLASNATSRRGLRLLIPFVILVLLPLSVSAYASKKATTASASTWSNILNPFAAFSNPDLGLAEELQKHTRVLKAMMSDPLGTLKQIWHNVRDVELQKRRFKQGFTDMRIFSVLFFHKFLWVPLVDSILFQGKIGKRLRADLEGAAAWWMQQTEGVVSDPARREAFLRAVWTLVQENGMAQLAALSLALLVASGALLVCFGAAPARSETVEKRNEASVWCIMCRDFVSLACPCNMSRNLFVLSFHRFFYRHRLRW